MNQAAAVLADLAAQALAAHQVEVQVLVHLDQAVAHQVDQAHLVVVQEAVVAAQDLVHVVVAVQQFHGTLQ